MISKAVASGSAYTELAAFDETYSIATKGSYMAYRDHVLWIGAYNSKLATRMYGYVVQTNTTGAVSLTRKYYMAMPNRTRAVSFDANGYMYVVRSSQSNNKQSGYLSQIRTYKPAFSTPAASGGVAKKRIRRRLQFHQEPVEVWYMDNIYIQYFPVVNIRNALIRSIG